jgi:hypothetical protein
VQPFFLATAGISADIELPANVKPVTTAILAMKDFILFSISDFNI